MFSGIYDPCLQATTAGPVATTSIPFGQTSTVKATTTTDMGGGMYCIGYDLHDKRHNT